MKDPLSKLEAAVNAWILAAMFCGVVSCGGFLVALISAYSAMYEWTIWSLWVSAFGAAAGIQCTRVAHLRNHEALRLMQRESERRRHVRNWGAELQNDLH